MDNISLSNETRTNGRLGCATEHLLTNSQTEMHHNIANVAGRLSISSASAPAEGQSQVFNPTPGGKFDPSSPAAFDARLWVKEFVQLIDSRPCIRTYSVSRCCLQGAQCLCIWYGRSTSENYWKRCFRSYELSVQVFSWKPGW